MRDRHQGIGSQSGISLTEVLIALAISTVIAAAMASLFASSIRSREQVDREGQKIENGRYALEVLADDLRLAGFYGDYMPRGATGAAWPTGSAAGGVAVTWTTPEPCAIAVAGLGWNNLSGAVTVPVHVFGYEAHPVDKNAAAPALSAALTACLDDYKSGTDVIVVRRLSSVSHLPTVAASATTTTVGDVYLQASSCTGTSDGGVGFSFAALPAGGANFNLHQLNCTTVAPIRKYVVRIYYVAGCDVCTPTDGMPTLKVAELGYNGGLQMAVRSVVPGVENMHFEYHVDGDGDGAGEGFAVSGQSPLTTSPGFEWQNVMAVKIFVLVRDDETTAGTTNSREYVFGTRTLRAFNDAYRRSVFASTVRHVNPSGARELP